MPSEEILNEFTKEESERKRHRQIEVCGSDVEGCNDERDRDGVQSGSGGDTRAAIIVCVDIPSYDVQGGVTPLVWQG